MCPGEEGYFWCSWLTLDESPAVTKNNVIHPGFSKVALTRPSLQVRQESKIIKHITLFFRVKETKNYFVFVFTGASVRLHS